LAHGETLAALCVEPEPKDLAVPQCRHQFCYDSTRVIEVTSEGQSIWECTGWGAAATCQGNRDYQAYRLGTRDLEMYLFFDPRVVGGHDPVTIEKAFLHLWMNVYFPPLLSQLAGIRPGTHAVSWDIGRAGGVAEIRVPVHAVPIRQGPTLPGWS
jgi:hypothetical protein